MSDFFVKRVVLPSGKHVDVVYFQPSEPATSQPVDLHRCPECASELVYPVSWQEIADDRWQIELRCPNCQLVRDGQFEHVDVERFDDILNRGTDQLIDSLERHARETMTEDVGRLICAINADALLPCDF